MTKQLAKDIRQYAKQNNMTVGNVLKMCKVNSSQLYNWQNGGYDASEETEMRVRGILGIPLIRFTKRTVSVDGATEGNICRTMLTKREVFALEIACAILSNPRTTTTWWKWLVNGFTGRMETGWAGDASVEQADELIRQLEKNN